MIAPGQIIRGKYRLVRLLGDGGMGSVYEARHEVLGTRVAIKVLHADLARRTGLVDRFLQEARVAAQIRSPHVVQVTDVDRTDDERGPGTGVAYIVMELLEGEPLSAVLDRHGKLPVATACDYAGQILQALEAAHALGVVHRDLKPENVFVTFVGSRPVLKLIDFGIAKLKTADPAQRNLTVAGVVMGTAEYMAPEQAYSADRVDARSDLYAVGVMLFEMLAGSRPVAGEDARVIALKVERGEVTPLVHVAPEVPREIAGLVHRAMAPRPEVRFESATAMRLALEQAAHGAQAADPRRPATVALGPATYAPPYAPPPHAPPHAGTHVERASIPTPAVTTERAPAMAGAHVPVIPPMALTPAPPTTSRRRRGVPGWVLVVVPLVVGGGAVAAVLYAMQSEDTPVPPPSIQATPAATLTAAPTSTGGTPSPPAPADSMAPLVPTPTSAPPRATSTAHPAPSGHPPAASSDATAPPPAFPASLPSTFPSAFPIPLPSGSALPFPIPSGFPTTFPFPIPGAPPAPSAAPSATPAPSPSSSPNPQTL